jgi:hypothetical protein
MKALRQQHDNLQSEVYNRFSVLLQEREQCVIFSTDDENYEDSEIVDVIDEVNGGTFSVYVCGITKGGMIETRDLEDGRKEDFRFSDLANILDRINIVELLEHAQNN